MLIRFSSIAAPAITMFGDDATQLIKMLGASGALPGAIGATDIPAAMTHLRQQLQAHVVTNSKSPDKKEDAADESDRKSPVALTTRAGPLIELLERAAAANAPVMWEQI